jgi:hypothetical protein
MLSARSKNQMLSAKSGTTSLSEMERNENAARMKVDLLPGDSRR